MNRIEGLFSNKGQQNKGQVVDLTIEKMVAEHYAKNFKEGFMTVDYCLELIDRASLAEALNEIYEAKIDEQEKEINLLMKTITDLQSSKPSLNLTVFSFGEEK